MTRVANTTSLRRWAYPCPVCGRKVRINKDNTIAAHTPPGPSGPMYCEGSREKVRR